MDWTKVREAVDAAEAADKDAKAKQAALEAARQEAETAVSVANQKIQALLSLITPGA